MCPIFLLLAYRFQVIVYYLVDQLHFAYGSGPSCHRKGLLDFEQFAECLYFFTRAEQKQDPRSLSNIVCAQPIFVKT